MTSRQKHVKLHSPLQTHRSLTYQPTKTLQAPIRIRRHLQWLIICQTPHNCYPQNARIQMSCLQNSLSRQTTTGTRTKKEQIMKSQELRKWILKNSPRGNSEYKKFFRDQTKFVLYHIPKALFTLNANPRPPCIVVGTYQYGPIRLPVYNYTLANELNITFKGSAHWIISVKSPREVIIDQKYLFLPIIELDGSYFEGFPQEYKFNTYPKNLKEFSLRLYDDYELYLFCRHLIKALNAKK